MEGMAFEMVDIIPRESKPRDTGLTMVLDKGLGIHAAEDLVMYAGEYIDIIKLGWGTHRLCPEELVRRKIELYSDNEILVSNGGTLFELAYLQDRIPEFFNYAHEIGLTAIEISDGSIELNRADRNELITMGVEMGFVVYTEIGKKNPEDDAKLSTEYRISMARRDLEAGAAKVIMEARESGLGIGIYDGTGRLKEAMVKKLTDEIGVEHILFEAPKKSQQVQLILNLTPKVNLGNVRPEDVIPLETLRRGLRGDTLGKI